MIKIKLFRIQYLLFIAIVFCFLLINIGCQQKITNEAKVGLVLAVGGLGDKSVNDSAYAGLLDAKKKFKIETHYVEPTSATEFGDHLSRFAIDGAKIVFGIGYSMKDPMELVAKRFPKTSFAIIDVPASGKNVRSLVFREHEGAFLAGALAAMMSRNKQVGFVGGMEIPLLQKWQAGFMAGAHHIDKDIKIVSRYLDTTVKGFSDPARGREIAASMYYSGLDVLLQVTGGSARGVYLATKESGKWAIGSDQDQDGELPGQILTSVVRDLEPLIVNTVHESLQSEIPINGEESFGLKRNGIHLTSFKYTKDKVIGNDRISRLDKIKEEIILGKIVVPDRL